MNKYSGIEATEIVDKEHKLTKKDQFLWNKFSGVEVSEIDDKKHKLVVKPHSDCKTVRSEKENSTYIDAVE